MTSGRTGQWEGQFKGGHGTVKHKKVYHYGAEPDEFTVSSEGELVPIKADPDMTPPKERQKKKAAETEAPKERTIPPEIREMCHELKDLRDDCLQDYLDTSHEFGPKIDECDRVESLFQSSLRAGVSESRLAEYKRQLEQCEEIADKRQEIKEKADTYRQVNEDFKKKCPYDEFQK